MLGKLFKRLKKDNKSEIFRINRYDHGYKLTVNKDVTDYDMMAALTTVVYNLSKHNGIKPSLLIRRIESWLTQYEDSL